MKLGGVVHCQTVRGKRIVTREYSAWQMMKNRCLNHRCLDYSRVSVTGARLDARWYLFDNFLADMGPKPEPDSSIHRFDESLGYSKDNCYWGPAKRKARTGRGSSHGIPVEFRKWISR